MGMPVSETALDSQPAVCAARHFCSARHPACNSYSQKAKAMSPIASVERQLLLLTADLENQTAQGSAKLLLKADDLLVNLHIPSASNKALAVPGTTRLSHCPFDFATKVQRMLMNLTQNYTI